MLIIKIVINITCQKICFLMTSNCVRKKCICIKNLKLFEIKSIYNEINLLVILGDLPSISSISYLRNLFISTQIIISLTILYLQLKNMVLICVEIKHLCHQRILHKMFILKSKHIWWKYAKFSVFEILKDNNLNN